MHGIIFNQLIKFVRRNYGQETLHNILEHSGIGLKFYDATKSYPDQEIEQILGSACSMLDLDRDGVLESFGEFIAPRLLKVYGSFIEDDWDAMDLLEQIEGTIHKTVRLNDPEIKPPRLQINREDNHKLSIAYGSKRNMLHLGIGIIKAIGVHYNTTLKIEKTTNGDSQLLQITRITS